MSASLALKEVPFKSEDFIPKNGTLKEAQSYYDICFKLVENRIRLKNDGICKKCECTFPWTVLETKYWKKRVLDIIADQYKHVTDKNGTVFTAVDLLDKGTYWEMTISWK